MKAYRHFCYFFVLTCLLAGISLYCGYRYSEMMDDKSAILLKGTMQEAHQWHIKEQVTFFAAWASCTVSALVTPLKPFWERIMLAIVFASLYPLVMVIAMF